MIQARESERENNNEWTTYPTKPQVQREKKKSRRINTGLTRKQVTVASCMLTSYTQKDGHRSFLACSHHMHQLKRTNIRASCVDNLRAKRHQFSGARRQDGERTDIRTFQTVYIIRARIQTSILRHHKKTRLSQAVPAGAEWHRGCQVVYQGSAIKLFKGLAWIITPSLVSRIVSTRPSGTTQWSRCDKAKPGRDWQ